MNTFSRKPSPTTNVHRILLPSAQPSWKSRRRKVAVFHVGQARFHGKVANYASTPNIKLGGARPNPASTKLVCCRHKQDSEGFGKFITAGFSEWTDVVRGEHSHWPSVDMGGLGWAVEVLSCFLEYPAVLDPKDVVNLSRHASEEWIRTCFLDTAASVENPFVAGMTLSVSLAEAAVVAPQGERRKLLSVQNKLDNLLLEVLERLPQTVQGFGDDGMEICQALFEPSVLMEGAREGLGPLRMILQNRGHMETFATQPLIVDFLSRRFANGLPDLLDTKNVFGDDKGVAHLGCAAVHFFGQGSKSKTERESENARGERISIARCLAIDARDRLDRNWQRRSSIFAKGHILDTLRSPCAMLQGVTSIHPKATSLSVLPGAQFLVAGLVAVPDAYYRVPAVRMVLDFVVYMGMLAVFSAVILQHDNGTLRAEEIVFAIYVLVSC